MVDVSTLLTLVTSATVVVVIIYYAFQTKTRTRLRENLLKVKNDILQAEKEFVSLYNDPRYFSKRDMHLWKQRWSHIAQLCEQCVRKRNLDLDFQNSITTVADVFQKGERLLEKRNAAFVEKEIVAFKDFFDSIESYPLTAGQRRAIVIDEYSSLVIAGAGTGKTSTIIGKAGYLIKKGLAAPEEILLIAFNRDIVSERAR
jgi:DNA helicase-4